jgi:hypothetical protein
MSELQGHTAWNGYKVFLSIFPGRVYCTPKEHRVVMCELTVLH